MIERERAKDLITHPDRWTHWPFLPLVEGHGPMAKCGLLIDDSSDPWSVWHGNLFALDQVIDKWDDFDTLEELLNSDWRVD